MAYKDEYEVARLYTDGEFLAQLRQQFDGRLGLRLNLAPPLFAGKDARGVPLKSEYSAWVLGAMSLLAKLKFLRGTRFDPFGWTAERKMERQLVAEYRELTLRALQTLNAEDQARLVDMLSLPLQIRGFGHVKQAAVDNYRSRLAHMMQDKDTQQSLPLAA